MRNRRVTNIVASVSPDENETLISKGAQSEVNSAPPTVDGTFVITEADDNPRLLEVSTDGEVLLESLWLVRKRTIRSQAIVVTTWYERHMAQRITGSDRDRHVQLTRARISNQNVGIFDSPSFELYP